MPDWFPVPRELNALLTKLTDDALRLSEAPPKAFEQAVGIDRTRMVDFIITLLKGQFSPLVEEKLGSVDEAGPTVATFIFYGFLLGICWERINDHAGDNSGKLTT